MTCSTWFSHDFRVRKRYVLENTCLPYKDSTKYEAELCKELEHSYECLDIPKRKRCRTVGELRDSSVEFADLLSPPVEFDSNDVNRENENREDEGEGEDEEDDDHDLDR